MSESCKTCRFWEHRKGISDVEDQEVGSCLRYPPSAGDVGDVSVFPDTYCISWCGEYQPNEQQDVGGMVHIATGCLYCGGKMDFVEIVNVKNAKSQCKQCGEQAFTPQGK